MSDEDDHGGHEQAGGRRTVAAVRRGWWPGWIWAIPVAAILLLGWWAVRTFMTGGEDITITFGDVHGLKQKNAEVVYRGMVVGKVDGMTLAKDGRSVDVKVHIQDEAAKFLTSGTVFWLRGASPNLANLSSLAAVLSGPTIMMEPGPGAKATHFVGHVRKPVVSGPHARPDLYGVSFNGAVGGVKKGDHVTLRGFTVGEIEDVGFHYDAATGEISTPVTLALYPSLFHIEGATASDQRAGLSAAIDRMVEAGLRARLSREPPLVGHPRVVLALEPGASPVKRSSVNGLPEIPAAHEGGLNSIVERVNRLPIEEIARNVLDITHHVNAIVSSPKLKDALAQLDATLAQAHTTVSSAGPQIRQLIANLRNASHQLEKTAKEAQGTLQATNRLVGAAPSQTGLPTATREITEAARSVRELADYLDRHPEALIEGKSGQ